MDRLEHVVRLAVRAERSRAGFTQQQLAEAMGDSYTKQRISNMERGVTPVSLTAACDVCAVLGVPLARLLVDAAPEDRTALGV